MMHIRGTKICCKCGLPLSSRHETKKKVGKKEGTTLGRCPYHCQGKSMKLPGITEFNTTRLARKNDDSIALHKHNFCNLLT